MTEQFRPTLLLSMPQLQDPNFAKTVVLLCDFVPEGAFGLVLNRTTEEAATGMVRLEPPVENGNELRLHTGGPADVEHRTIVPGLFLSTSPILLRRVLETRPAPRALVLAGYAGWGPGQLDEELSHSAWLMCDVDLNLVFDTDAALMWETAIRKLGADPSALQMSHGVH